MSRPTKDTSWGTLEMDGRVYDLLSRPLDRATFETIKAWAKEHHAPTSTAPWTTKAYHWRIVDGKLYLTGITIRGKGDVMEQIFHTNTLFAKWYNAEVKLLLDKEVDWGNREPGLKQVTMRVKVLHFANGVLQNAFEHTEVFKRVFFVVPKGDA